MSRQKGKGVWALKLSVRKWTMVNMNVDEGMAGGREAGDGPAAPVRRRRAADRSCGMSMSVWRAITAATWHARDRTGRDRRTRTLSWLCEALLIELAREPDADPLPGRISAVLEAAARIRNGDDNEPGAGGETR